MTTPDERTRALVRARGLLLALSQPSETPRVPQRVRANARTILRHFPTRSDIEIAHKAAPDWYGPLPREDL